MNRTAFYNRLDETLSGIRADGLWKHEHEIDSPQSGEISLGEAGTRINLCANNYLCLLYTSPSPRDATLSRVPASA